MSKKLTREFIAQKVKSDRIQSIKNLNLWGSDLDDVSIIKEMPALEVISLSVNKIRTLKDFAKLPNLKELYLRKNLIGDIREIKYLATCPRLQILWLQENPISDLKNYRTIIINALPNLIKLDDVVISDAERISVDEDSEDQQGQSNNKYEDNQEEDEDDGTDYNDNYSNNYKQSQLQQSQQQYKQSQPQIRQSQEKKKSAVNYDDYANPNQEDDDDDNEDINDYQKYSPNNRKNIGKVKSMTKKRSNNEFEYNEDVYQSPNSKLRRVQTAQERNPHQRSPYNYQDERHYQQQQQQEFYQKQKRASANNNTNNNKRSNVYQSVLLLLNELDKRELMQLKKELENRDEGY